MPSIRLDQRSQSFGELGLSLALQYGGSKEKSLSVLGKIALELNDVIESTIKTNALIHFLVMVSYLYAIFNCFKKFTPVLYVWLNIVPFSPFIPGFYKDYFMFAFF